MRYVELVDWPALVVTDAGILYPQFNPKQKRLAAPNEATGKPGSPRRCIFVGAVLIAAAIGWATTVWHVYRLDAWIVEFGVAVAAEVVKVGHLRARRHEAYGLVYSVALPDGRVMERTWHEEDGRWKAYRPGDRISIRYHPDNPERHLVEGRPGTSLFMAIWFIALGGAPLGGAGIVLLVLGLRRLNGKV